MPPNAPATCKRSEPRGRTGPLRLLGPRADDLAIISAAIKPGLAMVRHISYEPKARLLTIAFNRYCWEAGGSERVRSGLQLGGVMKVQAREIRRAPRDAWIEVRAVTFDEGEPPGGMVTISCAGGGDLRAAVECLDAVLADISE